MTRGYLWTVVILIAAIALMIGRGACGVRVDKRVVKDKASNEGFFGKTGLAPVAVTAFVVRSRDIPLVINEEGITEATDRFQAKAPADIKVDKFLVEEGDRVQPGDGLVKFDDEKTKLQLSLARAEIKEAEAELAEANYQNKNRDQLLEEGKLSEIEAQGIDERVNINQAKLDRAKAEVDLYELASEQEQLNSPIAGMVTKRETFDGSDVNEGQVLVEVVRTDPIYFTFGVPVNSVTAIERDAEIEVRFQALGGREFSGEVAVVGAGVERGEKSVAGSVAKVVVKLKIPNTEQMLKVDMRGDVVIRTQAREKIFSVPETALIQGDRSTYVFRIDGKKVKKVAVELGEPYNGQPTVTKGVSEGDTIVALSEEDLHEGAVVEISSTKAAER